MAKNLKSLTRDIPKTTTFLRDQCYRYVLSCQPGVTVTSCFVYKVIRDLESIDRLSINPMLRIGLIHK